MNSNVHPTQPSHPEPNAEALDGSVELNQPQPPTTRGYDRNRLKQIEQAINDRIRKHRTTPPPHQIEIDI